jgi:hypothetical protein
VLVLDDHIVGNSRPYLQGCFYLPDPVPERVVLLFVSFVDVPAGLPTPCALLDAAPTFVPVVPCMPVVGELVAEPVGAPAAVLFGDEVLVVGWEDCASAAPESASGKANAISFMCCPFIGLRWSVAVVLLALSGAIVIVERSHARECCSGAHCHFAR